jgi:hypothetical protein
MAALPNGEIALGTGSGVVIVDPNESDSAHPRELFTPEFGGVVRHLVAVELEGGAGTRLCYTQVTRPHKVLVAAVTPGKPLQALEAVTASALASLDNGRLAVGSGFCVSVWNVLTRNVVQRFTQSVSLWSELENALSGPSESSRVHCMLHMPHAEAIAIVVEATVYIWDCPSKNHTRPSAPKPRVALKGRGQVTCLGLLPCGRLVTGSRDG